MSVTPSTVDRARAAWDQFCETLQSQGALLTDGRLDVASEQELAEGFRFLERTAVHALQMKVEFCDPDFPAFFRLLDDRTRPGGPNIDNAYLTAPVRGDAVYRISGNTFGRMLNVGGLWSCDPDFEVGADGSFEVLLSAERPEGHRGNWAALPPGFRADEQSSGAFPGISNGTFLRVYYDDWADGLPPAELHVERVDPGRPPYPAPLDVDRVSRQLEHAARLLDASVPFWDDFVSKLRTTAGVNTMTPPTKTPPSIDLTPDTPISYGWCWYELDPTQALVIESDIPDAQYWGFQIYTRWWESPDFQNRQCSLNRTQAVIDADGRFRAVVAHSDPGCNNWLDTAGNERGFVFYRWIHTDAYPAPTCRVVALREVWDHLPSDHPRVDPAERQRAIDVRRAHIASRFQR